MAASDPAVSSPIPVPAAAAAWLAGWLGGMGLVGTAVLLALGGDSDDASIPQLFGSMIAGLSVFATVLWWVSGRHGGRPQPAGLRAHYGLVFRPVDLLGVPIGIATQLAIPLVYLPLQRWWPETFSDERLERTARELADKASGVSTVLLVVMVVVAAPLLEELVYRGLLQRALTQHLGAIGSLLVVSVFFALIHFRPVEYPGLVLAGLVFGAALVATGRIGMSIVTHLTFNAVAIAAVL